MTYALIVWSLIVVAPTQYQGKSQSYYEWRQLSTVENYNSVNAEINCHAIANELRLPKEKYRCIRIK